MLSNLGSMLGLWGSMEVSGVERSFLETLEPYSADTGRYRVTKFGQWLPRPVRFLFGGEQGPRTIQTITH